MKNGFTLVELLAVIAILSIVALITVPTVIEIYGTSKEKTFKSSVLELTEIAEREFIQNGRVSTTEYSLSFGDDGNVFSVDGRELDFSGNIDGGHGVIKVANGKARVINICNSSYCMCSFNGENASLKKGVSSCDE